MPRRGRAERRSVTPDPKYLSTLVSRVLNCLFVDGKKSVAEGILYGALDIVAKQTNEQPLDVLSAALANVRPRLEVRSRRVGGATYQVPMEVPHDRSQSLGIRWVINYARERSERTMERKLAAEIIDAFNKRGGAYKKREDVHRMAEANRAFAHYRW